MITALFTYGKAYLASYANSNTTLFLRVMEFSMILLN